MPNSKYLLPTWSVTCCPFLCYPLKNTSRSFCLGQKKTALPGTSTQPFPHLLFAPFRPECRMWTAMLLLGTCLLYCARVTVPICAVALSAHFGWDKKQSGVVLSSFFWGYCLTQVIGGHISDQYWELLPFLSFFFPFHFLFPFLVSIVSISIFPCLGFLSSTELGFDLSLQVLVVPPFTLGE